MRPIALAITCALGILLAARDAHADCDRVPAKVAAYLATRPGWHVARLTDLGEDDRALWSRYHGRACPGLSRADLQGHGRWSYGLSLMNGQARQTVILYDNGRVLLAKVLFTSPGGVIEVVHTAAPGPAYEVETYRRIDIRQQSLVFEVLESGAEQYYWRDGGLSSVVISE